MLLRKATFGPQAPCKWHQLNADVGVDVVKIRRRTDRRPCNTVIGHVGCESITVEKCFGGDIGDESAHNMFQYMTASSDRPTTHNGTYAVATWVAMVPLCVV